VTVLLALIGQAATTADPVVAQLLRSAEGADGTSLALARVAPDVLLAVASPSWDLEASQCLARDERYSVIAHAALFYRASLTKALDGSGGR
jgi:hypothetical protein